jgi:uncharacterized protein
MFTAIWNIWLELAPWLFVGAAAAGLMHVLVPADWMRRHLSGRMGVLKAVLIGIPLPLCSCGVIPVGLGLRKSGASNGAAVGFLISTPQTGVDSILVSASFLGWPFAILKVVTALVTGLIGGTLADSGNTIPLEVLSDRETSAHPARGKFREFIAQSLELIRSIWGWLVIGVLISAGITWMVPEQSLSSIPALTGIWALLITLVISLPLYVCATASVPIAAALVASGLPTGAALVFLMAGPATNIATLGAVYRTLGRRSMLIYLTTIVAGSLLAGLAFNHLIVVDVAHVHAHDHTSDWWRTVSAVALAGLVGWFAVDDARRWFRKRMTTVDTDAPSVTVNVSGMTCNGCAASLERALEGRTDVDSADVSFDQGTAVVYGTASLEQISETAATAGFVVDSGPK